MVRAISSVQVVAIVLCLWVQCDDGFVVPAGGLTPAVKVGRNRALVSKVQSRLEREDVPWRQRISMSTAQPGDSISRRAGDWQRSGERRDRPKSRFGRIVQRVSYVMRRVVLGHVPARDEASTRSRVTGVHGAQRTDHSYARSGIAKQMHASKVHDDTTKRVLGATSGGAGVSSELKHDGGVLSPTESDEMMSSLRRRIEEGLRADPDAEARETQRQLHAQQRTKQQQQQQQQQQRQQGSERVGREASFPGDTAVAELPPPGKGSQGGVDTPRGWLDPKGAGLRVTTNSLLPNHLGNKKYHKGDANGANARKRRPTPKLASREDVERMERLFGSTGGEPLT